MSPAKRKTSKKASAKKRPASKSLSTKKRAKAKKARAKPRVAKKKPNVPRPSQAVSVKAVGEATAWSAFNDVAELINEAHGCGGREYPHLMLMEDDAISGGTCAWYGFASPEERTAFILRLIELEHEGEDDEGYKGERKSIERRLAKIGAGPADSEQIDLALVSTVTWIGTLDELLAGKSEGALTWREKFWENTEDDERSDDSKEIDLEAPIPDKLVEDFLETLTPY